MKESNMTILKKINIIFRNLAVIVLVLAMIVTLIPSVSETVYADSVMQPPSPDTYIDSSAFDSAGTDYGLTKGKLLQAVYFGTNTDNTNGNSAQKQKWWIAGYDASGLVLMCDPQQPMEANRWFASSTVSNGYRTAYGTYKSSPANMLNANHYGASAIRSVLNGLATDESRFTQAEQAMMKETTVYTYDFANSTTYSVTDKLYLAAGCYNSKEVTVGQNVIDSSKTGNEQVHNGLKIGLHRNSANGSPFAVFGNGNFWTRSPADDMSNCALEAISSTQVFAGTVTETIHAVVPAFALDSDTVLFASSAPAGTVSTVLDDENTMTFRCDGSTRIGSIVTFTDNSVSVDYDDTDPALYLYVQGRDSTGDWFNSRVINGDYDIPSTAIHFGANLTNCKVWLETVDGNIAYAKPAVFTGAFPPPLYGVVDPPAAASYPYTGGEIIGVHAGPGYRVYGWIGGISVGEYIVDAELEKGYVWSDQTTEPKKIVWSIVKAANPMELKTKTATVKKSKVKKKARKLARSKVLTFTRGAIGTVTYTKLSGSRKLSIAKSTGTITIKKKTKKGTYSIKVKVEATGNSNYEALSKIVKLKVKVK